MNKPCEECNFFNTCMKNLSDSDIQNELAQQQKKKRFPFIFLNPESREKYFEKHRFSLRLWNRDCFILPDVWKKLINTHI